MMRSLVDELDHRMLLPLENPALRLSEDGDCVQVLYGERRYVFPNSDVVLLPIPNTTAEMLAFYLAGRLKQELQRRGAAKLRAVAMQVEESFGQSAWYREPLAGLGAPSAGMRILVHEFVSGGGLAGQRIPPSLGREGAAMRGALVADLAALRQHRIVTTADPRFPLRPRPRVEVVALPPGSAERLDDLLASADAAWLVAPETGGHLEKLAARAEKKGTALLGPGARAIRRAADKAGLARRLRSPGRGPPAHAGRPYARGVCRRRP